MEGEYMKLFDVKQVKQNNNEIVSSNLKLLYVPNEKAIININDLYDTKKTNELIHNINNSVINKELKNFLIAAAYRHTKFNYSKIADFYAKTNKKVQQLMESSALVILDTNSAIKNGYIELREDIKHLIDNGDL